MRKIVFLIGISFSLANCSDKKPLEKCPRIDVVNNTGKYQRVYCSELFSSIELIPLETRKECLLDAAPTSKVLLTDSFIFMTGDGRLYAFDRSGKFLNPIGEKGRGPGEYQNASAGFFLNYDRQIIYVQEYVKILEYDFNGKFIRSIQLPDVDGGYLTDCAYVEDNLFVGAVHYSGNNKYRYCLFDQNGDTVKCFPNHIFFNRLSDFASSNDRPLDPVRVDNRIYLKDNVNDTIYILANSNLNPAYVFDFGKYSYPKEALENIQNLLYFESRTYGFLSSFGSLVGTPKYFFYQISVPQQFSTPKSNPRYNHLLNQYRSTERSVYGIYNIAQNTNVLLDTDQHFQKGIINDMNGGLPLVPRYYAGNDEIVDYWLADDMKAMLTEEYFATQKIKDPQAHQRLRELLKDLKEDDNPIVVVAKLK